MPQRAVTRLVRSTEHLHLHPEMNAFAIAPIAFDASKKHTPSLGYTRPSNNAGGLEGGMTNGMPVVVKGAMKPISTLLRGLPSVNLRTTKPEHSDYERSDVCAVSAASVVMENAVAFEIARALLEKFPGDSVTELESAYDRYLELARTLPDGDEGIAIA